MRNIVRVLVADDQRMFAEGLARIVSDEPEIEIVGIASGGAEAIELASEVHPDVVLVDHLMPDLNGIEVTAAIKRLHPEIVVIMIAEFHDDRTLISAIEAGCSGFLTKDRAAAEVSTAIFAAAAGESIIEPEMLARLLPTMIRPQRRLGEDLTPREREVLRLLSSGASNKAIGLQAMLSVNTVRNYVQSILTKLDAHSKLEAVATAIREGIIDYPTRR